MKRIYKSTRNWLVKRGVGCFFVVVILLVNIEVQVNERAQWGDYFHCTSKVSSDSTLKDLQAQMQQYIDVNEEDASAEELSLYAKGAALIDGESLRLLYGKEEHTKLPMASTTKMMTCLYALENGNLDDVVTVSKRAAVQPKTHLGMRVGEQYYLKDLLYALMLESCNDCAVAIAEHISGSVETFCDAMTAQVGQWGLSDTQFKTPNGLDADGHYTTPYELAVVGAMAMRNETFVEIVNTPQYSFGTCDGKRKCSVRNKDAFLKMMDGAIGIKTGYTSKASYCFVGAVKREDRLFISAVLSSGYYPKKTMKWADTKKLMQYGVDRYERFCVMKPSVIELNCPVQNGLSRQLPLHITETKYLMLSPKDHVQYKATFAKKTLQAPVKRGEAIGQLTVCVNEQDIIQVPLYTADSCAKWNFGWCMKQVLRQYLVVH